MDPRRLQAIWTACLVESGLAEGLQVSSHRARNRSSHCYARTYPFIPLELLRRVLDDVYSGALTQPEALEKLTPYSTDAYYYGRSHGLYSHLASERGWVCCPTRFGFFPALFLGIGTYTTIFTMNMHEKVLAPMAFAGTNKAYCRDFLEAHGFPVAPGHLVTDPEMAVDKARLVGFPVVLKRFGGGNSEGVILSISNERDCREGAERLLQRDFCLVLEKMIEGLEVRLHFLSGRLHKAYRCEPLYIRGNGKDSIHDLMVAAYPDYFRIMSSSEAQRQRFVLFLWGRGVREFGDLRKYVPAPGDKIRVSAAAGAIMKDIDPRAVFLERDITRLEQLLQQYGAPSAGVDLMMTARRVPFERGGVILEINVPCGFAYLDEAVQAADYELSAAIGHDREFIANLGRVPVWLILDEEMRDQPKVKTKISRRFFRLYPRGVEGSLSGGLTCPWPAMLSNRRAEAFLISVNEAAILDHGMPTQLAPIVIFAGKRAQFRRRYPVVSRTAVNAKGRLVAVDEVIR